MLTQSAHPRHCKYRSDIASVAWSDLSPGGKSFHLTIVGICGIRSLATIVVSARKFPPVPIAHTVACPIKSSNRPFCPAKRFMYRFPISETGKIGTQTAAKQTEKIPLEPGARRIGGGIAPPLGLGGWRRHARVKPVTGQSTAAAEGINEEETWMSGWNGMARRDYWSHIFYCRVCSTTTNKSRLLLSSRDMTGLRASSNCSN